MPETGDYYLIYNFTQSVPKFTNYRPPLYTLLTLQVDNIFVFIHQVAVLFAHDNIFVFIHQVAPVPACGLFKTSATSWPLTFWPRKWYPSHVWRGLPLCQF